ncbi:hypothetical protein GCM10028791_34480 [Echinicola sediminis]
MKNLSIFYFAILAFTVLFSCSSKEDPTPSKTPEQIATEKISGESNKTWTVSGGSVSHKGIDVTSEWTGFEITFSGSNGSKSYATANNNRLFDDSGSWSFAGNNFDKMVLAGNQPAASQEISFSGAGSNLILEFNVPAPADSRVTALAGDYVFRLKAE